MTALTYHVISKEIESLDTIAFSDTHACINNPYQEGSGILTFLYKYYVVISDTQVGSLMCFSSSLLQYYQSFMRNQDGKIELQKRLLREIYVRGITFLGITFLAHLLMPFLSLFSPTSSPYSSDVLFEWLL